MKSLGKNLKKHLKVLCEEIGPRYYWGPNIRRGGEYIKKTLSGYKGAIITEEEISVPFMHTDECSLEVVSPEKKSLSCLPWQGFLPYFPSCQKGKGKEIELIEAGDREKNNIYSKKAILMDMIGETAFLWDIMELEKYEPPAIIIVDKSAPHFKSLKYGTSDLLVNIMTMPLLKKTIPKIVISSQEGDFIRKYLREGRNVLIDFSCFTEERRAYVNNIEVKFSPDADILLWAHYDSAPEDISCPGANDNASSVSVLLEFARLFHKTEFGKRLKMVFAGAEECCGFSGMSYFLDTDDFLKSPHGRTALMMTSTRVHERVLPVVKPLVRTESFYRRIKKEKIKNINFCLELECLGGGDEFYLLSPAKSLFSIRHEKISSYFKRPFTLSPQNLGLETHWINLYKKVSSGILAGPQEGYPFHCGEDNISRIDFNMMEESILVIRELLRTV